MSDLLKELKKERDFLNSNNQDIVNHVYNLCIKHIKFLNSLGNTNYIYEVPVILVGFPLYDLKTVSLSVFKKLKKAGFEVFIPSLGKIYISWKKI